MQKPFNLVLENFYLLLKFLYLFLVLTGFRHFLDTLLKIINLFFSSYHSYLVQYHCYSTFWVMSVSTPLKFAVSELGKHSARSWVTLFTLLLLTRWIRRTYHTYVFIHTLLKIFAETILVVLTHSHLCHLS